MKTNKLRLGPLPKTRTVKLTIAVSEELKLLLDLYAQRHSQVYGDAVDAEALAPHMLETFIRRDRGFKGSDVRVKVQSTLPNLDPGRSHQSG